MLRTLAMPLAPTLTPAACPPAAPTNQGAASVAGDSSPLDNVVKRTFTAYGFKLDSGRVLPEMSLAYETYGRLAPDGRNAILVTHGFTSSQHAAGKYTPADATAGSWEGLTGPGTAIATTRSSVEASDQVGS